MQIVLNKSVHEAINKNIITIALKIYQILFKISAPLFKVSSFFEKQNRSVFVCNLEL